jgi:hypothetical protein
MVSILHASARAALLAALVGAALVAPTAAAAQSVAPEQALLNRLQATSSGTPIALTQNQARSAPVEPAALNGERALLNHSPAPADAPVDAIVRAQSVVETVQYPTGVRALLNRSSL